MPVDALSGDAAHMGARASRTEEELRAQTVPVHGPAARAAAVNGSYTKLADVFHELLAEQGVGAVLQRVADALATLVPYSTLTIYEVDEQAEMLVPTLVRDRWASEIYRNPIPIGRGITGWAVLNRQPVILADGHLDPRAEVVPGTPANDPEAVISIPLIARDTVKGALNIYREGDGSSFLPEEFELARRFADAAALALDNAHLRSDLERRAQTDSLTGLYNHRFFHETLQNELRRGSASRKRVCLLMLDIDDFKQINDRDGHGTGDRVLTGISSILRSLVRDEDIVCRLGGEEFAIVMPSCDEEGALACATRIHTSIGAYRFQPDIQVTISAGIATSQQTTDPSALAEAADKALLAAKAAGKNRTVVYSDKLVRPDQPDNRRALATA